MVNGKNTLKPSCTRKTWINSGLYHLTNALSLAIKAGSRFSCDQAVKSVRSETSQCLVSSWCLKRINSCWHFFSWSIRERWSFESGFCSCDMRTISSFNCCILSNNSMSGRLRMSNSKRWEIIYILPNIRISEPFENKFVAIVNRDDESY